MVTLVPTGNGLAALTQQPWRLRSDTCEELRVFSSSSIISAEATNGTRAQRRRSTDMSHLSGGWAAMSVARRKCERKENSSEDAKMSPEACGGGEPRSEQPILRVPSREVRIVRRCGCGRRFALK